MGTTTHDSAAVDSAVDAHASRVLRKMSPPEAVIDPSLGPYVTSVLRSSLSDHSDADAVDWETVPEFESLLELLEEHCNMSPDVAQSALESIATAVTTGVVQSAHPHRTPGRTFTETSGSSYSSGNDPFGGSLGRSFRSGTEHDYSEVDGINHLGDLLSNASIGNQNAGGVFSCATVGQESVSPLESCSPEDNVPSFMLDEERFLRSTGASETNRGQPSVVTGVHQNGQDDGNLLVASDGLRITPTKADSLIPGDLLGVLDDPSTPKVSHPSQKEAPAVPESEAAVPSLNDINPAVTLKKKKGKKKSKAEASDLAAALFKPSRSYQHSEKTSPAAHPLIAPSSELQPLTLASNPPYFNDKQLYHQQIISASQILLSMNPDVGEEAAAEAAAVSNADVNVAQYLLDEARNAPPVCRHMLNDGCYRSDCQFSHVTGSTCLFWVKGRCGKGESCRFLHGFSEKLLEGNNAEYPPNSHDPTGFVQNTMSTSGQSSYPAGPIPIQTTNLVQHNMASAPFSFLSSSQGSSGGAFDSHGPFSASFPSQPGSYFGAASVSSSDHSVPGPAWGETGFAQDRQNVAAAPQGPDPTFSFASVATSGYSQGAFTEEESSSGLAAASKSSSQKQKFAKIPQDLWNPSQNRDSSVFHITDPVERYHEVAACHPRKDVIDLHFQSLKTFPAVLAAILPDKLEQRGEVWVVTGTGHHVGKNTHQKSGGALESGVLEWLEAEGYAFQRGRDRNGYGGAILVKQT